MHGLALNVDPDMAWFDRIVPVRHRGQGGDVARGRRGRRCRCTTWSTSSCVTPCARWAPDGRLRAPGRGLADALGAPAHSAPTAADADPTRWPTGSRASDSAIRLRQAGVDPGAGLPGNDPQAAVAARPGADGRRVPRPAADGARPRSRDGVRRGGLPQHLRVLGRRHGHVHDQRRALHARRAGSAWSTPDTPSPPMPTSPSGWPPRWSDSAWPMPWSLPWRATTSPTAGRPGTRPRSTPSAGAARRRRSRCSSPTARATRGSLAAIFDARPDVLNHNLETVARLQRAVRPSAGYARSLGRAGPGQGRRARDQVRA